MRPFFRNKLPWVALAMVAVGTRWWAKAASLEGWDGVDFALALHEYDLAKQQPHFPGYPLYIAAARIARLVVGEDVFALVLPCVLAAGAGAAAAYAMGGLAAACLFIAAPGLWLLGGKALSDGAAVGLLLVVYALARTRPGSSGLVAGLLLGIRLPYLPALLGWAWLVRPSLRRALGGVLAGVALWAIPLTVLVGPRALLRIGFCFTEGHFSSWGGALGYGSLASRSLAHGWSLAVFHLGAGVSTIRVISTVALLVALGLAWRKPLSRTALLCALPYALWIVLGQNPDRPRHTAPLAAAVAMAASPATVPALIAAGAMTLTALPLAHEQRSHPSPDVALATYVAKHFPAATRIYGWEEIRMFAIYGPQIDARRARSLDDLDRDGDSGVLFTSNLRDKRQDRHCFEPISTFRGSPLVFHPNESLTLFRYCGRK